MHKEAYDALFFIRRGQVAKCHSNVTKTRMLQLVGIIICQQFFCGKDMFEVFVGKHVWGSDWGPFRSFSGPTTKKWQKWTQSGWKMFVWQIQIKHIYKFVWQIQICLTNTNQTQIQIKHKYKSNTNINQTQIQIKHKYKTTIRDACSAMNLCLYVSWLSIKLIGFNQIDDGYIWVMISRVEISKSSSELWMHLYLF